MFLGSDENKAKQRATSLIDVITMQQETIKRLQSEIERVQS